MTITARHGYDWVGHDASDHTPFVLETRCGAFCILPCTNMSTDVITMRVFPQNSPFTSFESFRDTFDALHTEGAAGTPTWLDLKLRSQMAGRAALIPAIRGCLDMRQHDGIHYAGKCDLAGNAWEAHRKGASASL